MRLKNVWTACACAIDDGLPSMVSGYPLLYAAPLAMNIRGKKGSLASRTVELGIDRELAVLIDVSEPIARGDQRQPSENSPAFSSGRNFACAETRLTIIIISTKMMRNCRHLSRVL